MDKLLTYFINEPEKEFHVRELAKLAGKSPTTVSKYLHAFAKEHFLTINKSRNHLLFKADTESTAFKDMKVGHNLSLLRKSGLIKHLADEYNQPAAIILFGSFARGENVPQSDIDILVITPVKKEVPVDKFEKSLHHRIQLFLHSAKDIEAMKTLNKELLNSWINGMVVHGYWEVFT
ncbi:nucleotidyltransferase domain-containing protein [Candidatus Woesearchaeota archaeon]|nr:nucleotidyltransferase domain-containing protein [Candidatus Woesearchaeota archaeon]